MPHTIKTLAAFHFDPKKSGQIFKDAAKEKGLSHQKVADLTGITYDTVSNSFGGKINELSFERVFKFCAAFGIPVDAYIMMMLQDENIDFSERVLFFDSIREQAVSYAQVSPEPTPGTHAQDVDRSPMLFPLDDHVHFSRENHEQLLDRFKAIHTRYADQMQAYYESEITRLDKIRSDMKSQYEGQIAQMKESRAMMKEQYDSQIATMTAQHDREREALVAQHEKERNVDEQHFQMERKALQDTIDTLTSENARLRRRNFWLSIALTVETAAVLGITLFDALNHDVGWFRGLLIDHGGRVDRKLMG